MMRIIVPVLFLCSSTIIYVQQFNTDNYITMPHGTATFVLTAGQRNANMYGTFSLLPGFEIGIMIFSPQFLKKDFIKNNHIEY